MPILISTLTSYLLILLLGRELSGAGRRVVLDVLANLWLLFWGSGFLFTFRPDLLRKPRLPVILATLGLAFAALLTGFLARESTVGSFSPAGLLLLTIVVPISEELFFRGMLLGALSQWTRPYLASLGVSLLFGLLHLPQAAAGSMGCLSLVLCTLTIKGGIVPAIVLHMAWNLASLFPYYTMTWRAGTLLPLLALVAGMLFWALPGRRSQ